DVDLRGQGPVYRALIGDLGQAGALIGRERAGELDDAFDMVQPAFPGIAVVAIGRVYLRVTQSDGDTFERPAFAARIHLHRNRCARAQGGKEQVVRRRAFVLTARRDRLVGGQPVSTDIYVLGECCGVASNNDVHRSFTPPPASTSP